VVSTIATRSRWLKTPQCFSKMAISYPKAVCDCS